MKHRNLLGVLALSAAITVPSLALADDNLAETLLKSAGKHVERLGEQLLVQLTSAAIGNGTNPVRKTQVIIFNHTDRPFYFSGSTFESGGFSPGGGSNIGKVNPNSINGYTVESHGVATGVTNARITFSDSPGGNKECVKISTSNPYVGSNHAKTGSGCGFRVNAPVTTVGNHNEVYVDVF